MLGMGVVSRAEEAGNRVSPFAHLNLPIEDRAAVRAAIRQEKAQVVINCAGRAFGSVEDMLLANAVGPHILAEECEALGIKFIHISTDCVFSGVPEENSPMRRYSIEDRPDPITPYGRSKLAGEPMLPNTLVVRTSFVGLSGGLGKWLLDQKGKEVLGWTSAMWTGTSVSVISTFLIDEATKGTRSGLHHFASSEKVSKHWLLQEMVNILGLDVRIKGVATPAIDLALFPTIDTPPLRDSLRMLADEAK